MTYQNVARFMWVPVMMVIFLFPFLASAASLYIDPPKTTLYQGDSVTLAVRIDTDEDSDECINAVDGVLNYSSNLQPVDVSIGESIFSVWVEQPTINKADRTITFAGGIPNGYCGRVEGDPRLTNVLTEIVFRSSSQSSDEENTDLSSGTVSFSDETTVYLNDGKGTNALLETYPATINLDNQPGVVQANAWKEKVDSDFVPPEKFSISLIKDDKAFSQKYYIVFNTTDKQTGIDSYQVIEEPITQFSSFQWGRANAPWVEARSPYVLKDQSLNSTVRVKAIDKAGNEYIATLVPDKSLRTVSEAQVITFAITSVSIVLLLVFAFLFFRFYKKKSASKKVQSDDYLDNKQDYE